MDPITLALIVGLGGGVLGGVVSQLIAGLFKTRGDTRQLDAANEIARAAEIRWQKEQAFEREKLLHAAKREAYAGLITKLNGAGNNAHRDIRQAMHKGGVMIDVIVKDHVEEFDSVWEIAHEVRLMNEDVGRVAYEAAFALADIGKAHSRDQLDAWTKAFMRHRDILLRACQADLRIAIEGTEAHNEPQLNEAPVSGKTKPIKH